MKTVKIAVIAMMGLSLGINAQQWNSNGSNTTTGNITINSGIIDSHFKRKFDYNGGGWARTLIEYENSLMSSGNFRIGSYGGTTNYTYSYIGYGTYSDVKNLKLYPNGNVAFGGSLKIGNFTTGLNMNTAGNDFLIQGVNVNFATWNSIHLRADGSDGLYLQKDTNRVGIGTTSPNAKLDIKGDLKLGNGSTYTDLIFKTGTNISGTNGVFEILPKTIPGSGIARQTTYFKNASHSNGKTEHNVVVDGNVGIGTTSPKEKLDVNGSIVVKNGHNISWGDKYGAGIPTIAANTTSGLHFYPNGSTLGATMQIFKDGKTRFTNNIAVLGKIESKEVKVTNTPTADFVFEENYNLPTLKSIEKHIKEKKHLPEIASAKEMEKNGVNVGNFQIQLLQKIEELTLYTIEQGKKIKAFEKEKLKIEKQQKEINTQKKEIEELKKQNSRIKNLEKLVQKLLKNKN